MDRSSFLYSGFIDHFSFDATPCQDRLMHEMASFLCGDDGDIMIVNGYAGTGKTSAISAIISSLTDLKVNCVLLAPTGRAAKVLSLYSARPASTIHKHIYRQKSVGNDGFGQFSLSPNKSKDTVYFVDEASLIGIENSNQSSSFGSGNLLEDLVRFVRNGTDCRLVLIGDAAQLPPVGLESSPVFSESYMSGFGGVRSCSLTTVVRQAGESGILHNATLVREMISFGYPDDLFEDVFMEIDEFDDIERVSGSELIEKLTDAYDEYGEDDTIILCRSNKRAIRYNLGLRSSVQFKEESLVRGDKLMIVKNCYQFLGDIEELDYIANGDIAELQTIRNYEERYGLHFADAVLSFPDYDNIEISAKVCLDTLESESPSLTYEQQNALYAGVSEDYAHLSTKKKRYEAVREDKYYNALQLKYANAVTCHKSQGGQWRCVFIDCPFWQEEQTMDDLKWLYTALTRAVEKVYLVNFKDRFFI